VDRQVGQDEQASRGAGGSDPCAEAAAPRALCVDLTGLFFSEVLADVELARAICRRCELQVPCAVAAAARGEPAGVWGGWTAEELAEALEHDLGGPAAP
jgi:hypothetical protein